MHSGAQLGGACSICYARPLSSAVFFVLGSLFSLLLLLLRNASHHSIARRAPLGADCVSRIISLWWLNGRTTCSDALCLPGKQATPKQQGLSPGRLQREMELVCIGQAFYQGRGFSFFFHLLFIFSASLFGSSGWWRGRRERDRARGFISLVRIIDDVGGYRLIGSTTTRC